MKPLHAIILGSLGLTVFAICGLHVFTLLDFPSGLNRHISGNIEIPLIDLYFILSWFHVPLGAVLGLFTAYLMQKSPAEKSEKYRKIAIIGSVILLLVLLIFIIPILYYAFQPGGSKYYTVLLLTFWLGIPGIWAVALLAKGLKIPKGS